MIRSISARIAYLVAAQLAVTLLFGAVAFHASPHGATRPSRWTLDALNETRVLALGSTIVSAMAVMVAALLLRHVRTVRTRGYALLTSERFAQDTLDSLSAHVAILDETGTVIAVNRAYREFAQENGASPGDVCELSNYLAVCDAAVGTDAATATEVAAGIRAVLAGERAEYSCEYACHSTDEQRWFQVRVTPFHEASAPRVVVAHENISAQQRAEEALRKSEEEHRVLFENARDALMTIAPPGWRFVAGNRATLDMFRLQSVEELQRATLWELSPATQPDGHDSRTAAMACIARTMETGAHEFEWTLRRADGSEFPGFVRLHRFDLQGNVLLQATIHDISEKREAERRARLTQRLESIGTLAGGIAHDLNNALTPILMSIETLRRDYAQESDLLDAVYASARRGAQMVRQLLTFAKGMEGERHALQPAHLLKELRSIMGRTFPKSIDVDFRFDPTLPLILGDATQIHQVLLNLCVNARDAMPVGGHLVVEADACEIDPVYASSIADAHVGPYLRIRVRDTGTGMASDVMERIFEPFYSTKGPERGTGLGLSTALGIVRSHGGFMRVYSEPGEGSTFAVYLPIEADATEGIHDVALRSGFRGSQELVLIVDDERGVLAAGETVLRGLNLEPCVASDGVEALLHVTAHRERLRVAVVDLHMPHLDGVGFCRALRRLEPEMPIIIMSGRLEDAARDALEGLGVQAFLSKPFSEAELAHELEHALRSPQASEAAA